MSVPIERYTPSQTKRFEISKDTISRTRLKAVVDTTRDLQDSTPLVGVSLWGSLSKGKLLTPELAPSSDIELVAFYDPDKAEELCTNGLENISVSTQENIRSGILTRLERNGDSPDLNISVRGLTFEGDYSIFARVMETVTGNYGSERELNGLLSTISAFFGLDVAGGLKPYRARFFEQVISVMPQEKADRLWEIISENMIKIVERGVHGTNESNIPKSIERFYPTTFNEAVKFYGSKLNQPNYSPSVI